MKTQILKKARKRYKWYYSNTGDLILVDLKKNEYHILNELFLIEYWNQDKCFVKEAPCEFRELAFITLKRIMFSKYGWNVQKMNYKLALKSAIKAEKGGYRGRIKIFEKIKSPKKSVPKKKSSIDWIFEFMNRNYVINDETQKIFTEAKLMYDQEIINASKNYETNGK